MEKIKLSKENQLKLAEYFVAGVTSRTASSLVGVNIKTGLIIFIGLEN